MPEGEAPWLSVELLPARGSGHHAAFGRRNEPPPDPGGSGGSGDSGGGWGDLLPRTRLKGVLQRGQHAYVQPIRPATAGRPQATYARDRQPRARPDSATQCLAVLDRPARAAPPHAVPRPALSPIRRVDTRWRSAERPVVLNTSAPRPTSSEHRPCGADRWKFGEGIDDYLQTRASLQDAEAASRESQWETLRLGLVAAQEAEAKARRRRAAKKGAVRDRLLAAKREFALQQRRAMADEHAGRVAVAREVVSLLREAQYDRWLGATRIATEAGLRQCEHWQAEARLHIVQEELVVSEHQHRKLFLKVSLSALAVVGEAGRGVAVRMLREIEARRRHHQEQEQQLNRMVNTEVHHREQLQTDELVLWMAVEKGHTAWVDEQNAIREARLYDLRMQYEEQQRLFAKQRFDLTMDEAQARPKIRLVEAGEKMKAAQQEADERKLATARASARIAEERRILDEQHARERLPLQRDEELCRRLVDNECSACFFALASSFDAGCKVISRPIYLRLPESVSYSHGCGDIPIFAGASFGRKPDFNPRHSNRVLYITVDIGITDQYAAGDCLTMLRVAPTQVRNGFRIVKLRARATVVHLALMTGRASDQGPFPGSDMPGFVTPVVNAADAETFCELDSDASDDDSSSGILTASPYASARLLRGPGPPSRCSTANNLVPMRNTFCLSPHRSSFNTTKRRSRASVLQVAEVDANRFIRLETNLARGRDPFEEVQWMLRNVSFSVAAREYHPLTTSLRTRRVSVVVSFACAPSEEDVSNHLKTYTCVLSAMTEVPILPPLLYLPPAHRQSQYSMARAAKNRASIPQRDDGIYPFRAIEVLRPDADAGDALVKLRIEKYGENEYLAATGEGLCVKNPKRAGRHSIVAFHDQSIATVVEGSLAPTPPQPEEYAQQQLQQQQQSTTGGHPVPSYVEVTLKMLPEMPFWKVGELLRSLCYKIDDAAPNRRRRVCNVVCVAGGEQSGARLQTGVQCWISLVYAEQEGPNVFIASPSDTMCLVWRSSAQASDPNVKEYIQPALRAVTPQAIIQNQHGYGLEAAGVGHFRSASLLFKIEQGVHFGDSLVLHNVLPATVFGSTFDFSDKSVVIPGKGIVASWETEMGGSQSAGTYEGSTSPAWLSVSFHESASLTEEEVAAVARCACFTVRGTATAGIRGVSCRFKFVDPSMPSVPEASVRVMVKVCLPVMTIAPRFQQQKFVENSGFKKFASVELSEPVFKDDEAVAVFDGGRLVVDIVKGASADDVLALAPCSGGSKEYDIVSTANKRYRKVHNSLNGKLLGYFLPYTPERNGLVMYLGGGPEEQKPGLETARKHARGSRNEAKPVVKKKELIALLRNLQYTNTSGNPYVLRKLLRVTVVDTFGAFSQVVVQIDIQTINDKTEVTLPCGLDLVYRQSTRADENGFQLARDAELVDLDTPEFKEGCISLHLASGGGKNDKFSVLNAKQQKLHHHKAGTDPILVACGAAPADGGGQPVTVGGFSVGTVEAKNSCRAGCSISFHIKADTRWPGWDKVAAARDGGKAPGGPAAPVAKFTGNPADKQQSATAKAQLARRTSRTLTRNGSTHFVKGVTSCGVPLSVAAYLLRAVAYTNTTPGAALRQGKRVILLKVNAGDNVPTTVVKLTVLVLPPLLSLPPASASLEYAEGSGFAAIFAKVKVGLDAGAPFKRGWLTAEIVEGFEKDQDELFLRAPADAVHVVWETKDGAATRLGSLYHQPIKKLGDMSEAALARHAKQGSLLALVTSRRAGFDLIFTASGSLNLKLFQTVLGLISYRNTSSTPKVHFRRIKLDFLWSGEAADDAAAAPSKGIDELEQSKDSINSRSLPPSAFAARGDDVLARSTTGFKKPTNARKLASRQGLKGDDKARASGAAKNPLRAKTDVDEKGFEHCSVAVSVQVIEVDNLTEFDTPHEVLYHAASSTGAEPLPLDVFRQTTADDPDTPVFPSGTELVFEVIGGNRCDVIDLSAQPFDQGSDPDSVHIAHDGGLTVGGCPVGTVFHDSNTPYKVRVNLVDFPLDHLGAIVRRAVYRCMGAVPRPTKKQLLTTLNTPVAPSALSGNALALPGKVAATKMNTSTTKVTVHVVPAVFDYPQVPGGLVQLGDEPVVILSPSTKMTVVEGVEVRFELIRVFSGAYSKTDHSSHLVNTEEGSSWRQFWLPFEAYEWGNTRGILHTDGLVFLPLPPEYTIKRIARDQWDVHMAEGKLCTISAPPTEKSLPDGKVVECWHTVRVVFSAKVAFNARVAVRVLRSIAYAGGRAAVDSILVGAAALAKSQAALDASVHPSPEGSPNVVLKLTTLQPVPKPQTALTVVDHVLIRPTPPAR
ncbi:hypothetical protein DIPPA_30062 [Diplonema papillatum]|nr:hypothetical protein DIPPA_30062 [Diplonema papillatum]